MGQFKERVPSAKKASPGTPSRSGSNWGFLWFTRASPISAGVGFSMPIAGHDPDETVFSDIQSPCRPPSDSFTQIQRSFWWLYVLSCFCQPSVLLRGLWKGLQHQRSDQSHLLRETLHRVWPIRLSGLCAWHPTHRLLPPMSSQVLWWVL